MLFKTYLLLDWLFIAFFSVETSFTSSPSGDQTINEGSNLTLFCNTTGKPDPTVNWTRVLENGTNGNVVFFGNPWVIVNMSRTATGTYRCTAYNGIGNPVNHSLYVNVTCKYTRALYIREVNNYYIMQPPFRYWSGSFPLFVWKKRKTQKGRAFICTVRFLYKICIRSGLLILSKVNLGTWYIATA